MDWTQLVIENSKVTQINAGGEFGNKLRDVMDRTKDIPVPNVSRQGPDVLVGSLDRHQPAHPPAAQGFPVRLCELPL